MSKLKSWRDWWYLPFAVVYFLGVTLYFTINTRDARDSVNWPSTAGQVTRSEVTYWGEFNDQEMEHIAYTYTVNGQTYLSGHLSYGGDTIPPEVNEDRLAHFPLGQDVTVYYDPDSPSTSVLYPGYGYRPRNLIGGALLIFFIIFGVLNSHINPQVRRTAKHPARKSPRVHAGDLPPAHLGTGAKR